MSLNSSLNTSAKVSSLMSFLDSQDTDNRFNFLENLTTGTEALSAFSETKAKLITLKIELEESNKSIESLKSVINKLKYQNEELERTWQDKLNRKLEQQQKSYDETLEKNVSFIENLLKDKEQRLKYINELTAQISVNEDNYKNNLNSLHEHYKKEIRKNKDNWITGEKLRREKWEKEKTKEIKEMTARGLEPEINRIISDHRKNIEEKEENHKKEVKALKDTLETKYTEEIVWTT
jgi:5-azacytidine-induced protein 1